jgi:hypothetical protein
LFLPPCSFLSFSEDSIISLTLTLKPLGINHVHRPTHAPTGPRVRQLRGCHFISLRRAVAACWSESSCSPRHCTTMGWESRRASVGCLRVCTRVSFFCVCRCTLPADTECVCLLLQRGNDLSTSVSFTTNVLVTLTIRPNRFIFN